MAFSHLICTFYCDLSWIFANQTFWTAFDSWVINLSFEQFPPVYISCRTIDISSNLL